MFETSDSQFQNWLLDPVSKMCTCNGHAVELKSHVFTTNLIDMGAKLKVQLSLTSQVSEMPLFVTKVT